MTTNLEASAYYKDVQFFVLQILKAEFENANNIFGPHVKFMWALDPH